MIAVLRRVVGQMPMPSSSDVESLMASPSDCRNQRPGMESRMQGQDKHRLQGAASMPAVSGGSPFLCKAGGFSVNNASQAYGAKKNRQGKKKKKME